MARESMADIRRRSDLTKRQETNVRVQIAKSATLITERLLGNALGTLVDENGDPCEMSMSSLKAATALLDKSLPNLQSIDSTVHNQAPTMSEADAVARLSLLLAKHPELAAILTNKGTVVDSEAEPPRLDS